MKWKEGRLTFFCLCFFFRSLLEIAFIEACYSKDITFASAFYVKICSTSVNPLTLVYDSHEM